MRSSIQHLSHVRADKHPFKSFHSSQRLDGLLQLLVRCGIEIDKKLSLIVESGQPASASTKMRMTHRDTQALGQSQQFIECRG